MTVVNIRSNVYAVHIYISVWWQWLFS